MGPVRTPPRGEEDHDATVGAFEERDDSFGQPLDPTVIAGRCARPNGRPALALYQPEGLPVAGAVPPPKTAGARV